MPADSTSKHTKKQRKLYSCTACRIRKKKCDRVRPICSRCKLGGLKCLFTPTIGSPCRGKSSYLQGSSNVIDGSNSLLGNANSTRIQVISNQELTSDQDPSLSSFSLHSLPLSNTSTTNEESEENKVKAQIAALKQKLKDIEFEKVSKKTTKNKLDVSPNEVISFYYDSICPINSSTNSIVMAENFHDLFIFFSDSYIAPLFKRIRLIHRESKEKIRMSILDDIISLNSEKYPKEVYDDIKLKSALCMIENTYNKKNKYYQYYADLACSFHKAKATAISFNKSSIATAASKSLISKVESMLPRLDILNHLFKVFENYVHPFIPILNLKVFKEDIVTSIIGLRFADIRVMPAYNILITTYIDLVNIGILFMVLRLAYLAIKIDIEIIGPTCDIEREMFADNNFEFVGPEFVNVLIECSNKSKVFKKNTFNSLALRFLHVYYVRICEERDLRSALLLVPVLLAEASVLGLFRDWTKIGYLEIRNYYAGMGLHTREDLLAYQQRVYPLLKYTVCYTRFTLGGSFECNFLNYEYPNSDFSDLVKADKANNHFLSFLTFKFEFLKPSNDLLLEITEFFKNENTSAFKNLRTLVSLKLKLDLFIENRYTDFPLNYFADDENFLSNETFKDNETTCYHMMLRKITKFQDCISLYLVKIKLLFTLWTHYERSFFKTDCRTTRLKYLKNWVTVFKELQELSFDILYLTGYKYTQNHKEFFKLDEYPHFKNFGSNTNTSCFILLAILIICYSTCFRIFNTLRLLSTRKQDFFMNIKDLLTFNNNLIKLKDLNVLLLEYISFVFHQRYSPFYTQTGKMFVIFKDVIAMMKSNIPLNNQRAILDIFSSLGCKINGKEDETTIEPNFDRVNIKGDEIFTGHVDEMFLHLNDYSDFQSCMYDITNFDKIFDKYKAIEANFNILEWLKFHTLLMKKDDKYNIIDVNISFRKMLSMLKFRKNNK